MPSLSPKDRVSLCLFSFTDGRRCRTPRTGNHPHFCFYHAQKEARAQVTEKLAKDLAYFFSGDYLSACDLSTALSRLIPAVVRGDIKPRLARTVAYMFQTQLQAIHLSQREYVNAFGAEGWRKALRSSVDSNSDYLFPSDPETEQPAPPAPPQPRPQQPIASSPQTPQRPQQSAAPTPQPPSAVRPTPTQTEAALSVARSLFPRRPNSAPTQPPAPTPSPATHAPQPPAAEACHPERSEGSCLNPATPTIDKTRPASAHAQSAQPNNAPLAASPHPQPQPTTPSHDRYAVHFDHNCRLRTDGKFI